MEKSFYRLLILVNQVLIANFKRRKYVFKRHSRNKNSNENFRIYSILGLTGPLFNRLSVRCHLGYSQENEDRVIREVTRRCHFHVQLKLNRSIPWGMYRWLVWPVSQCMRFPTMWYVRPAKPQISLRIRAV